MNQQNNLSDDDFIPFLQSLGVETYNKKFEWMLNDPDYASVFGWIYNSLDQNNALTEHEEYRYVALEKQGELLSHEELEAKLLDIQSEFKGLVLPGDEDSLDDVQHNIEMQKERLAMLKKHEEILKEMTEQNEIAKKELTIKLTKLNAAQKQAEDEVKSAGEECVQLAKQVESITNGVVNVVADAFNVYGSCTVDTELAKRFFIYGPFVSYNQTQELFKSQFDLFKSMRLDPKHNNSTRYEDMSMDLKDARNMEGKLSDAVTAYIETKAQLSGEQAKLYLVSRQNADHLNHIAVCSTKAHKSAIQLLEQEESILDQQLQNSVKHFVDRRTSIVVDYISRTVLADREQLLRDVTFLKDVTSQALSLDRLLYYALRHELRSVEEWLHFATELRTHLLQEGEVVSDRIQSMNEISMEQDIAEINLKTSNILLNSLHAIFNAEPTSDPLQPIKLHNDKRKNLLELKDSIHDGYMMKEAALVEIKNLVKPLHKFVWDGCTKQPVAHNRSVASMSHTLKNEMAAVDDKVGKICETFNAVKNGDKHNLRKLWQWFLAEPEKLLAMVKSVAK